MGRKYRTPPQRKRQKAKQRQRSRDAYYGVDYVSKTQQKKQRQRAEGAKLERQANGAPPPPGEPEGIPAFYASVEWKQLRLAAKLRDKGQCVYCGTTAQTADHVIPRKLGGPDTLDNLVACCHDCNGVVRGRLFASVDEKRDWILWARQQDVFAA